VEKIQSGDGERDVKCKTNIKWQSVILKQIANSNNCSIAL